MTRDEVLKVAKDYLGQMGRLEYTDAFIDRVFIEAVIELAEDEPSSIFCSDCQEDPDGYAGRCACCGRVF
jgi:hypothetical protein